MKWFITFGSGTILAKYYVEFDYVTNKEARKLAQDLFPNLWSRIYSREEFNGQVDRYGLMELDMPANYYPSRVRT